jgi:fimbrial chaperone protein
MFSQIRPVSPGALAALVLAVLAPLSMAVQAATLQVTPITVAFDPGQNAQALYLVNSGQRTLDAQVRVLHWSQKDGLDQLSPADDIVASPSIVKIAPGERQTVRLVRRDTRAPETEKSYRVLVDELPQAPVTTPGSGVTVLLRYSIPVFIHAAGSATIKTQEQQAAAQQLPQTDLSGIRAWLARGADGRTALHVANDGKRHVRLTHLSLARPDGGKSAVSAGLVGYVLAGQQMQWPVAIPLPLPAGTLLKVRFNDDRDARPIPLAGADR